MAVSLIDATHALVRNLEKMFSRLFVITLLGFASVGAADEDDLKNSKRSITGFGYPSWNSIGGNPWSSHYPWQTNPLLHGSLYPLPGEYSGKGSHLGLPTSSTHDIATAVAAAKEATAAAALARQRVQAAREQVVIQERVAAAKEAAAHAAIQRSEAAAQVAAAIQKSEALAAAAAAVHKSAAASAVSAAAAHAAGHFTSGPWIHSKPGFSHWG